jgi:hypothetical protein
VVSNIEANDAQLFIDTIENSINYIENVDIEGETRYLESLGANDHQFILEDQNGNTEFRSLHAFWFRRLRDGVEKDNLITLLNRIKDSLEQVHPRTNERPNIENLYTNTPEITQLITINDRSTGLRAVQSSPGAIIGLSSELRADREIVLEAVRRGNQYNYGLIYGSEELQNDRDIIRAAVTQDDGALYYANEEFKNDRDIVLAAISENPYAINYASETLRNDREFILAAVSLDGRALYYVNEEFHNDRVIVFTAVTQYGQALRYASETLRNDPDVIAAAVASGYTLNRYNDDDRLRNNRPLVQALVAQDGLQLRYASEELRNDKETVLIAVAQNPEALQFASEALRADPDVIAAANE